MSPLLSDDLVTLSRVYLTTSTEDCLNDQILITRDALQGVGAKVTLEGYDGVAHSFFAVPMFIRTHDFFNDLAEGMRVK